MMIIIAIFLFAHGMSEYGGNFMQNLQVIGPDYASIMNSKSTLYYDFFSVFLSGFIITFALMFQPHILTKVLYIKEDKDVNKFIATTFLVTLCFSLILFVGFFAKLSGLEVVAQDQVVTNYILQEFGGSGMGDYIFTFVSLTMLAAGLSTLDGILVAISSMVVNDIYLPFKKSDKSALMLSRIVLVSIGVIAYLIALNPPKLVGLFAQKGVYGLAAASFVPILFGVLLKRELSVKLVFISSLSGIIAHLALNLFGGVLNPAVSSTYGIFISLGFFGVGYFILYGRPGLTTATSTN